MLSKMMWRKTFASACVLWLGQVTAASCMAPAARLMRPRSCVHSNGALLWLYLHHLLAPTRACALSLPICQSLSLSLCAACGLCIISLVWSQIFPHDAVCLEQFLGLVFSCRSERFLQVQKPAMTTICPVLTRSPLVWW